MGCGRQTSSGFRTTNNVLLSPKSGWEQGEILCVFLLPHPSGSCHPFSRQARRVGGLLPWLWGIQTGAPWKPPERADTAAGTKLFQVQKQDPDPFLRAVEGPGEGHQPGASHPEDLGPQPQDRRRREETGCEACSDIAHPSPEMALQA